MEYFNPQPKPVKKDKGHSPTRIARRSAKRAAQDKKYNARVKEWLKGKSCAVFPYLKATQCHHMKGRIGELLLDERYWLPVSTAGHDHIELNPQWALDNGFRLLRTTHEY